MSRSRKCPKCQATMILGFIIDQKEGGRAVSSWLEGAPAKSIWTGVKLDGKTPIEIATWRCGGCGLLESYANPD